MNTDRDKNCLGYTLVEIMIAMLITFIILGGVFKTIGEDTMERENKEKILEMQNNARVALNRLTNDIRRAGFLGCGGTLRANTLSNTGADNTLVGKMTIATPPGVVWNGSQSILAELKATGVNVDYLGEILGFYDNADAAHPYYREGADAISLVFLSDERAVNSDPGPPIKYMTSGTADINLISSGFSTGDILYITDCENISIFQKTNSDDTLSVKHDIAGLNNSNDLGAPYGAQYPARVYKLNIATYFIKKDTFSLFYNGYTEEVAANIEDIQLEFLFDEDNDGDLTDQVWRSVNTTGACPNSQCLTVAATGTSYTSNEVRAVRVWVLAMSDTVYSYTDTNTYDYPNSPYYSAANPYASARNASGGSPAAHPGFTDAEHRYRYLSSAVVYLRNAGL